MLGIRHFHDCAIDLFLGDISEYACDVVAFVGDVNSLESVEACKKLVSLIEQENSSHLQLLDAGELPAKHFIFSRLINSEDRLNIAASYQSAFEAANGLGLRHITILTAQPHFADIVFQELKVWIENRSKASHDVRRISFILRDQQSYNAFQKELFKQFPEE